MTGEVVEINHGRGMVAVVSEQREYTIIEMMRGEPAVGDRLAWHGSRPMGSGQITNETQGRSMCVVFQNHWVPKLQIREHLLYE